MQRQVRTLIFGLIFSAGTVSAAPYTVGYVGAADNTYGLSTNGVAYFQVVETLPAGCWGSVIYIDLSKDYARSAYNTVLMATALGRKLSRIDYTFGTNNGTSVCWARLVEMAPN